VEGMSEAEQPIPVLPANVNQGLECLVPTAFRHQPTRGFFEEEQSDEHQTTRDTRGRVAGLFQEFLVIGSTFAYWLNYGVALHVPEGTSQWRIPVGIQECLVPTAFRHQPTRGFFEEEQSDEHQTTRDKLDSITPVFVSENCPPATRGRVAGLFQEFLVIGSTFAYWLKGIL
jgi:MFS family permease